MRPGKGKWVGRKGRLVHDRVGGLVSEYPRSLLGNRRNPVPIGQEKFAHVFEIAARETLAKLAAQAIRQGLQQLPAIFRPVRPLLFFFDDPPADLEIDHDLQRIDLADGCVAGVFDQGFNFTQQEIIAGQGR
ncbi:MAG: hypothetical protein ACD_10C00436G0002 [uncultured bacterium]|nr:MAG: hypothetical protein ACD_10C00436G0002 [uncultured bacterium]